MPLSHRTWLPIYLIREWTLPSNHNRPCLRQLAILLLLMTPCNANNFVLSGWFRSEGNHILTLTHKKMIFRIPLKIRRWHICNLVHNVDLVQLEISICAISNLQSCIHSSSLGIMDALRISLGSRYFAHLSRPFLEKNNVLIKETITCISIKTAIVVSYTSDNILVPCLYSRTYDKEMFKMLDPKM